MRNIAVIGGGDSAEIVISKKSRATIVSHISKSEYNVFPVMIVGESWTADIDGSTYAVDRSDFSITKDGIKIKFDFAYITIHGTPGEDGKLQGYFDLLGIPYNTPNQLTSALTFNKWTCNTLLKQLGVNCATSYLLRSPKEGLAIEQILDVVGLPCFVKPNDGGSSFGASKVDSPSELLGAIEKAFEYGDEVIVEEMLSGTEVTCGIVQLGNELKVLGVTEIVTENEFFDFEAKYEGKSSEITPARISSGQENAIHDTVKFIYRKLGIKGVVRIDFILQKDTPYVIEVNTTPGMSEHSIIPQQAHFSNITLQSLFSEIIEREF